MLRKLLPLVLLTACAAKPLSPERTSSIDQVSAVSLLGDQLVVDVDSRTLLHSTQRALDASSWDLDGAFRAFLQAGVEERGRKFVPLAAEQAQLEKVAGVRESRWKKIVGRQSQALLDLLFETADRQGVRYLFLLTPPTTLHERFPQHRGNFGAYCNDRSAAGAQAYVYFFFDFALWDVPARRKVFAYTVDPSVTEALPFGGCSTVSEMKEPVRELQDPVKTAARLVVDALFEKMGWKKPQ